MASQSDITTEDNIDNVYSIDYESPGTVFIFNNATFKNGHSERQGSDKDVTRLTETFQKLGFKIETYNNKTSSELRQLIDAYGRRNYEADSCFICFIMSHGDNGCILGTDGDWIDIKEFVKPTKTNKSLLNKPKLFFTQACRGNTHMSYIEHDDIEQDAHKAEQMYDVDSTTRVPEEGDFLFGYSCVEGYYSYRKKESGSLYIQTLWDVFTDNPRDELSHALVEVNKRITTDSRLTTVATYENRLRKKIYLGKKCKSITKTNTKCISLHFFYKYMYKQF